MAEVFAQHLAGEQAAQAAAAIHAAERDLWELAGRDQSSSTLSAVFERAGIEPTDALLASYSTAWEPHTYIDPDVPPLLAYLRESGIKVGVLSNTFWPRSWHEEIFRRDGVLDLIDGAVYSSEIGWTKPHPEAFRAAMAAVGMADPARACSSATGRSTTCTARRAWACGPCWCPTVTCRPSPASPRMPSSAAWPTCGR